eukprot:3936864-Rhodomonas_salina.3
MSARGIAAAAALSRRQRQMSDNTGHHIVCAKMSGYDKGRGATWRSLSSRSRVVSAIWMTKGNMAQARRKSGTVSLL